MPESQPSRPVGRRDVLRLAGLAAVTGAVLASPATSAAAATPPPASAYSADVAVRWFRQVNELVRRTPGFSPPVASRALGYAGVTLYQAVVPGMPGHRSLSGQLDGLGWNPVGGIERGQWPLVANAALAEIARRLFPTAPADLLAGLDVLEAELATSLSAGVSTLAQRTARLRGRAVATVVFDWSTTDGGHEAYLGSDPYVPTSGPGRWRPTPPAYLPALQARWGEHRTMVPGLLDRATAPAPPPYSPDLGSVFYAAAREVYDTGTTLTPEQRAIALFWADGPGETATPSGHWVSILSQVLADSGARLDVAAEAYARLGIAVTDAFICCWATKYEVLLLRPVTYVQDHIDPSWLPLIATPPFPEYTSGHSVQSAASATVLTDLLGPVSFIDASYTGRGLAPRSFPSFDAAAAEAAVSRVYGGIHYRFGVDGGIEQGRRVGDAVAALGFRT